jgi:hypothetical protein
MNSNFIKISCLLIHILICCDYNNNLNKKGEKKTNNECDSYCIELYQLLMALSREDLLDLKSLDAERWITILVTHFESKEEFEKCANLHKLGYQIYNTID